MGFFFIELEQSRQSNCAIRSIGCAPLLLMILFLTVIYANSFDGTWIFDDTPNIVSNQNVHMTTLNAESIGKTFHGIRDEGLSRPLSYLTFSLNYHFHGLDVFGYHLVNFIIHCLSALFLFLFIFHTLHLPLLAKRYAHQAGSIALLATVLWAVSPIQVTAVTYIVQRMASMAGMFFIMAMFFYLKGRTGEGALRKVGFFILCLASALLAVASKENAAILPVVIFLYDLILIQGVNRETLKRNLLWAGVPLGILVVLAFVLTNPLNMLSGYANREFTLMERLLTQPRILLYYVSLLFYPIMDRLTLIHEIELSRSLFTPWTTLPAILFWFGVVGLGAYMARKQPLISFCLLFFVVTHMIESSIIPLELIYEHRNYIPSISFYLLLALGFFALFQYLRETKKTFAYIFVAGLLSFFIFNQGYTVYARNVLFHHPLYLWQDNFEKAPGLSRVHNNLGKAYWDLGHFEEARPLFTSAVEADRYHRSIHRAQPLINLGQYYLIAERNPALAIDFYEQARAINPNEWPVWLNLATALMWLDHLEWAERILSEALSNWPQIADFRTLYGMVMLRQGQFEAAIRQSTLALALNPHKSIALKVLGEAQMQQGNYQAAFTHWRDYVAQRPAHLEANLALLDAAHRLGDERTVRQTSVRLLALKAGRTWGELFATLPDFTGDLVYSGDPYTLLPVIRQGVDMELKDYSGLFGLR